MTGMMQPGLRRTHHHKGNEVLKYLKSAEVLPDAMSITSVGSVSTASWLWLTNVNQVLAAIAFLVAIASGIYSIYKRSKNGNEPR